LNPDLSQFALDQCSFERFVEPDLDVAVSVLRQQLSPQVLVPAAPFRPTRPAVHEVDILVVLTSLVLDDESMSRKVGIDSKAGTATGLWSWIAEQERKARVLGESSLPQRFLEETNASIR
jgi:hypothetical protein